MGVSVGVSGVVEAQHQVRRRVASAHVQHPHVKRDANRAARLVVVGWVVWLAGSLASRAVGPPCHSANFARWGFGDAVRIDRQRVTDSTKTHYAGDNSSAVHVGCFSRGLTTHYWSFQR